MEFTILEEAILYNALKQYISYCENCLGNSENKDQFTFIREEIEIVPKLQEKIKSDYLSKGGELSRL